MPLKKPARRQPKHPLSPKLSSREAAVNALWRPIFDPKRRSPLELGPTFDEYLSPLEPLWQSCLH
jgi:hypothetical protein